jgi:hypothetical protein
VPERPRKEREERGGEDREERGGEDGEGWRGKGKRKGKEAGALVVIITVPTLDAATSPEDAGARGASVAVA